MNEFCANFYALWHYYDLGDFSRYMYESGAYPAVFYVMLAFIVVPLVLYYVVIDHIQLARWWKWLVMVFVCSLACAIVGALMGNATVDQYLIEKNIHHTSIVDTAVVSFGLIVFAWTAVLSFVASLLFQHLSVKSRRIPF